MRTTIGLDEHLLRQLKRHAAARGQTLTAVIDEAVRQFLARAATSQGGAKRAPFRVMTFSGRLRPGVDLDGSAPLLDLMGDASAPRRR
jgi:hypothetical protein